MVALGLWSVAITYLFGLDRSVTLTRPVAPGRHVLSARADSLPTRPSVEIKCDEVRSRSVVATVRFRLHRPELNTTRLDITDSDNGFRAGRFASLVVSRGTSRVIRRDAVAFGVELKGATIAGDSVVVHVDRLQPGIDYVWRVIEQGRHAVVSSESTQTPAIACP